MKRWMFAASPALIVLAVNLALLYADNHRQGWVSITRPLGATSYAVHAAAWLGVALLAHAALRGMRAWHLIVPALPPITSALFDVRSVLTATASTIERHDKALFWPDHIRALCVESAATRLLASVEGVALALALAFLASRARPARWSLATLPLAAASFAATAISLYGPLVTLDANRFGASKSALAMLGVSIVAPVLFASTFDRVKRDGESSPSTPYREAPEPEVRATPLDLRSVTVMSAALLPFIARGITRSLVHFASFPFDEWRDDSLEGVLDATRRDAWLSLAWRWDRAIIPLTLGLVALSVARGLDRRALRVWALAVLCVFVGDLSRAHALHRLRASMVARRTPFVSVATPGVSWLERASDMGPLPPQLWRANGSVETLRADAHRDEWHLGPLVFGDPSMRARVWSAHLRRFRASSRDGVLTFAGQCSPSQPPWFSDPRQEVDLSNVYGLDGCHTIVEVASSADRTNALILRVMSASTLRSSDDRTFEVSTFTSQAMTLVLVPGGDSVTASEIVSVARSLAGRGSRVMLGD